MSYKVLTGLFQLKRSPIRIPTRERAKLSAHTPLDLLNSRAE